MTNPIVCSVLHVFDPLEEAVSHATRIGRNHCSEDPTRVGIVRLCGTSPDYAVKGYIVVETAGLNFVSDALRQHGEMK